MNSDGVSTLHSDGTRSSCILTTIRGTESLTLDLPGIEALTTKQPTYITYLYNRDLNTTSSFILSYNLLPVSPKLNRNFPAPT